MSHAQAKYLGFKYYFTNKPCKRGHLSKRTVSSRNCWDCNLVLARKNPNKLAYMSRYAKENKEQENARSRAWHLANRERHRQSSSNYYQENKEALAEMNKEWRGKNKHKVLAYSRARKSRVRCAEGTWSFPDIDRLLRSQKGICVYCEGLLGETYHVDHIMPLCLGGSNWPSNLQLLCPTCNMRKGGKQPEEFERQIGYCRQR